MFRVGDMVRINTVRGSDGKVISGAFILGTIVLIVGQSPILSYRVEDSEKGVHDVHSNEMSLVKPAAPRPLDGVTIVLPATDTLPQRLIAATIVEARSGGFDCITDAATRQPRKGRDAEAPDVYNFGVNPDGERINVRWRRAAGRFCVEGTDLTVQVGVRESTFDTTKDALPKVMPAEVPAADGAAATTA